MASLTLRSGAGWTLATMKENRVRILGVLLMAVAVAAAVPAVAEEPVPATWKRHDIAFTYMGFTTRYSCEGLRDKMRVLLRASGVRPDFEVNTAACSDLPGRVTPFPRVRMVFFAPSLPEAGARDVGEATIAAWRPVTLSLRQPRGLETGDCELVEQFRDRVLSAVTVRAIESDIRCIPHQLSGSSFRLSFQVLEGAAADVQAARR